MKADELSETETRALIDGGNEGGAYLDSIGKTDLAALSQEEFQAFLRAVLDGFGGSMRRQCAKIPVPF
jgi:hypothetical protein